VTTSEWVCSGHVTSTRSTAFPAQHAVGFFQLPALDLELSPGFYPAPAISTDCFSKRIYLLDTSAFSALGVSNDNALYKSTYLLTYSLSLASQVIISEKTVQDRDLVTMKANRKSYVAYQIARIPVVGWLKLTSLFTTNTAISETTQYRWTWMTLKVTLAVWNLFISHTSENTPCINSDVYKLSGKWTWLVISTVLVKLKDVSTGLAGFASWRKKRLFHENVFPWKNVFFPWRKTFFFLWKNCFSMEKRVAKIVFARIKSFATNCEAICQNLACLKKTKNELLLHFKSA